MPNLTESQNIKLAAELAKKAFDTKRPLVDVVEKTARELTLNPEQIRTLARMANVAMFQEQFKTKTGSDRQVEFATVDAESVIGRIHANPNPPQSANVTNDKMASARDYDLTPVRFQQVKVAGASAEALKQVPAPPIPEAPRWIQIKKAQHLFDEYAIVKSAANQKWESCLQTLTRRCREQPTETAKIAFLNGLAQHVGADGVGEISAIASVARVKAYTLTTEKVAHLREYGTNAIPADAGLLSQAVEQRKVYERYNLARLKIKEQYPEVV